ncbi:cytochrome P450 [Nocardia terpenica]|uniref:Cytochrome n=1 Tax=Nocardia terpenica TaxID=455432 RepID=A0A161WF30_9NOCA|nr:cytochrome P450 [Nocardia terpenica]KZM75529.1 cytochrome [Nocardia terpenica]
MTLGCFPIGAGMLIEDLERDPHPLLAELRTSEPVSWLPVFDGWLVTGYHLARTVLRDAETFTVDDPRFSTARLLGPNMLSLDGTAHARHRDPFARPFRPPLVRERLTEFVHTTAEHLLATIMPNGRADLRAEFAGPLAVTVMAETLGLPDVDATTIRSWYQTLVAAVSDLTAGRPADANDVRKQLRDSVIAAADSALFAAARAHGLDTEQVAANAAVLMFGGIDTTEGMITNTVVHLLDHPNQHTLVQAEPNLLPAAIEESLRLEPTAAVVDRYATADTELGGVPIARGDLVRVSLAGANRDPEIFTDPDRFSIHRSDTATHLTFARGPHSCFGAPLARLETEAALEKLLTLPGLRLDEPARPHGLVFRKPLSVQVRWD